MLFVIILEAPTQGLVRGSEAYGVVLKQWLVGRGTSAGLLIQIMRIFLGSQYWG